MKTYVAAEEKKSKEVYDEKEEPQIEEKKLFDIDEKPKKKMSFKTKRYTKLMKDMHKMRWSKDEARQMLLGQEWYSCKVCLKHTGPKDEK